jgi:NADH dehydrogenase
MPTTVQNVVTGAFGYTGRYIARRLLGLGETVRTLTGHPDRPDPFDGQVEVVPFKFDEPAKLLESLRGVDTLYNTYWVRFSHGTITFEQAIENTKILIQAAVGAGVRRFVHVSITSADEDSPLPYFRGKGIVERAIQQSGLSYAILRPTVIFGPEDILVNNIAWLLRRFPLFAVPGAGSYRLQPIFVEDVAETAVDAGHGEEDQIIDAVGPEIFTFDELVRQVADAVGSRARIVHVPPGLALRLSRLVGYVVGDVVLTDDELHGLMGNLLISDHPPTGHTRLSEWLAANSDRVGAVYASELERHYR